MKNNVTEAAMSLKDEPVSLCQIAYGLLWRSNSTEHHVCEARQWLLNGLSQEERKAAIAWVIEKYGPMRTSELIAADIRTGRFPKRDYFS
jgi:hypothetical protein